MSKNPPQVPQPLAKPVALIPPGPLRVLRAAAADCTACPLWRHATQTVFGEGAAKARVVLIGEQPGAREDETGHPFVGPSGQLLDEALEAAGLQRSELYVTNAVKHFKWEPRGKVRLHKRANAAEQAACRPWLAAERAVVAPRVVVCLGATAARAVLGRDVRIADVRGAVLDEPGGTVLVTTHPSALLRLRGRGGWDAAFAELTEDLRTASRAARR